MVTPAEPELAGLLDRHVDVVPARQEAVHAEEAVALVAQVEQAGDVDGLALALLAVLLGARLVGAITVATPAATTTTVPALAVGIVWPAWLP